MSFTLTGSSKNLYFIGLKHQGFFEAFFTEYVGFLALLF